MDCEKFDRLLLDLLYDELDELTGASARRHLEQCARCRPIARTLQATRLVGALPLVEAPAGLESRVLEAERRVRAALPLRRRLGRAVSIIAFYAMRPQLAMAVLLGLMIGLSWLVLRTHPSDHDQAQVEETGLPEMESEVRWTERGSPELEPRGTASRPEPDRMPPAEGKLGQPHQTPEPRTDQSGPPSDIGSGSQASTSEAFAQALKAYRDRRFAEAERVFGGLATSGGPEAPQAALWAARALHSSSGCGRAIARFEQVAAQFPGTGAASEALWQAAECQRFLGHTDQAASLYRSLLDHPGYRQRARQALRLLGIASAPIPALRMAPEPESGGGGRAEAFSE